MSLCFLLIVAPEWLGCEGLKYLLLTRPASLSRAASSSGVLFVPFGALVAKRFVSEVAEFNARFASPCPSAMDVLNCISAICAVVAHVQLVGPTSIELGRVVDDAPRNVVVRVYRQAKSQTPRTWTFAMDKG